MLVLMPLQPSHQGSLQCTALNHFLPPLSCTVIVVRGREMIGSVEVEVLTDAQAMCQTCSEGAAQKKRECRVGAAWGRPVGQHSRLCPCLSGGGAVWQHSRLCPCLSVGL